MTQPTIRPSTRIVPEWLQNLAAIGWRLIVSVGLLIVVVGIAMVVGTVTASILVAGIVAATFAPFALRLRERGWSRTGAAAAVMFGIVVMFAIALALIALAFLPYAEDVAAAIKTGEAALRDGLATIEASPEATQAVTSLTTSTSTLLGGAAAQIVGSIADVVTVLILSAFLVFFFLQDGDRAWVWLFQAMHEQDRERITTAGDDALARVGGYLRGMAVLATIYASTSFVFLYVLGVPLAAPLAVLVFFGGFIPYVGGIVTTIAILLVAYATAGPQTTFVLFLLIAVRNVIVSDLVRPLIYGRTVNIHPALVLVALPAGAAVAGIVGLFVAIPVAAMVLAVAGAAAAILDPGVPSGDPLVPGWLERLAAWSWRLLVAIGIGVLALGIVAVMPLVALPLMIATILAATFAPLVDRLVARGMRRGRAALGATFGALAARRAHPRPDRRQPRRTGVCDHRDGDDGSVDAGRRHQRSVARQSGGRGLDPRSAVRRERRRPRVGNLDLRDRRDPRHAPAASTSCATAGRSGVERWLGCPPVAGRRSRRPARGCSPSWAATWSQRARSARSEPSPSSSS